MGKLMEKSEGYYLLNVKIGSVEIEKAFMDADKPLEEISKLPMPENGFCLDIPDKENGISYGKDYENCKYPYFHTALSIDWQGKYIHYSHYGSSATKVTIPELLWIIEVIFEMSPTEFLNEYIPMNESKYKEV